LKIEEEEEMKEAEENPRQASQSIRAKEVRKSNKRLFGSKHDLQRGEVVDRFIYAR